MAAFSIHSADHFMGKALGEAQQAQEEGEVPIGAVIVGENRIIAKAYNQVEKLCDPTAHAELIAITAACEYLGAKYLSSCTLYVTLEPCPMCAQALHWAQIGKVVYACSDDKRGFSTFSPSLMHPKTEIETNVMQEECSDLLRSFFQERRRQNQAI